jgi:hypothetical protein
MDIEDLLEATENETPKAENFLLVEGKKYHKSSIVSAKLTSKQGQKVVMRTLRVCGVTVQDLCHSKSSSWNPGNIEGDNLVKAKDLLAALVYANDYICLVVVKVLYFEKPDKSKHIQVELDNLEDNDQKFVVVGQILDLISMESDWIWAGYYIRFGAHSDSDPSTSRQYVIHVSGVLVYPLAPELKHSEAGASTDNNIASCT